MATAPNYTQTVAAFRADLARAQEAAAARHAELMAEMRACTTAIERVLIAIAAMGEPAPAPGGQLPAGPSLTDPQGNVWTFGPNNATLKNGAEFAGRGTEYRLVDGVVQVLGLDGRWWAAIDNRWVQQPAESAPPVGPGPDADPSPNPSPTPTPTPSKTAWTRSRPFVMPAIRRSGAELMAKRLALHLDKRFIRGRQDAQTPNQPGIWPGTPYMGGTGEREELGLIILDDAIWLMGQSSPSDMIIWAETHGQVPVHFRVNAAGQADPNGAIMVDITKLPRASCYSSKDAVGADPHFVLAAPIEPDLAHYPSACYVPYLATGDLFYLQEVQDAATYALIWGNPGYRDLDKGWLGDDQIRGYAWGLNLVAQAYLATLEAENDGPLPAPLLPSAYWKRILDYNAAKFNARCVQNVGKSPLAAMGLLPWTAGYDYAFWQHDMLGAVMGWMIWTGQFPEWRENYQWVLKAPIARASGLSGYPRTRAIRYAMKTDGVTDWAGLAARNSLTDTADATLDVMDVSYGAYLRGNLALGVKNEMPGVAECFAWVDPQILWVPEKWAIAA